jgi:predicted nucleic acid-binding protein
MTAKAFVDTNIYIYALTQSKDPSDETKGITARAIFETLLQSQAIVTSIQVLNEFHSNLVKKFELEDVLVFNIVEQNILPISLIAPIGFQTYCLAYRLRIKYSLSFWDSLIVASALENQCTTLYSEDMQHQLNVEGKLLIINPFIG